MDKYSDLYVYVMIIDTCCVNEVKKNKTVTPTVFRQVYGPP